MAGGQIFRNKGSVFIETFFNMETSIKFKRQLKKKGAFQINKSTDEVELSSSRMESLKLDKELHIDITGFAIAFTQIYCLS